MTANEESFMRLGINYLQRLYKLRRRAALNGSFGRVGQPRTTTSPLGDRVAGR